MSCLPLAKDIMVTNLVTVAPEDDVLRGIRLLLHHRITGAPVVGNDRHYLGMLSEGSCMRVLFLTAREAGLARQRPPPARNFMVKKLLTLSPEADAIDAIARLLKHGFSGASVVDEEHREQPGLFLSAVMDPSENPLLQAAHHPVAGPLQQRS